MKKIFFVALFLCFVFISSTFAANLNLEQLLDKIQANQNKIQDMYAETTTKITSNLRLTTNNQKSQTMIQKGKMWTKGKDKSKIEMLSPMRQITITNGDKMAIINPETGQKMIQDLSKIKGRGMAGGQSGNMDLEKALEYFDLSVKQADSGEYVITGIPKKANKFLGKMEFYVDAERWVPVKILMYTSSGKLMSRSEIEYERFPLQSSEAFSEGGWVPVKNVSNVNTPMGRMEIEMTFENIKVNKGIKDGVFAID